MPEITVKQKILLILFGLLLGIILLEIGLRIGGFILTARQERANRLALQTKGASVVLCLGESTTFDAYPKPLEEVLNERCPGTTFTVIDGGRKGTNTAVIVSELEDNLNKYNPDMVVVMMGINDTEDTIECGVAQIGGIVSSLKSFRTYKLSRLIGENLFNRFKAVKRLKAKSERGARPTPIAPRGRDEMKKAEEKYVKELEGDPGNLSLYIALSDFYRGQGRYREAEETCRRALEISPDFRVYLELGHCLRDMNKNQEAEEMYKKVIELGPEESAGYRELATFYIYRKRYGEAEEMYRKAIALAPLNYRTYLELGWCYERAGRYEDAENIYKKAIGIEPENDQAYAALAVSYMDQKKYETARRAFGIAERLRLGRFNQATVHNYQKLAGIILQRGMSLVAVQYPVRKIEPLKKILGGKKGVIFVDNESVFKDVLKRGSYGEYFEDNYGGDFGHCTPKGNRLLAENIADAILSLEFKKIPGLEENEFALLKMGDRISAISHRILSEFEHDNRYKLNNLLDAEGVVMVAASHHLPSENIDKLLDHDPGTIWHVAADKVGKPSWVMVDFGEGQGKIVRSLAALPRQGMPRQFFRNAGLFGSTDGLSWVAIAPVIQKEVPHQGEWSLWDFVNDQAFRYYKLMLYNGHEGGEAHHFYSMAELALFK